MVYKDLNRTLYATGIPNGSFEDNDLASQRFGYTLKNKLNTIQT